MSENMEFDESSIDREKLYCHIAAAFLRNAVGDAQGIHIETIGDRVILRGTVDSWRERAEAERAAAEMPGVGQVENYLAVGSQIPEVL